MLVNLDFSKITTKRKFHRYIKKSFKLKHYYDNLDSFYDLMGMIDYELIINANKNIDDNPIKDYIISFFDVLDVLVKDNNLIKVNYIN